MTRNHLFSLIVVLPALTFLMVSGTACGGSDDAEPDSALDALERKLQMGRHEQLVEVRARPDSMLTAVTTDGCSGGLSVGWEYMATKIKYVQDKHGDRPAWESCCVTHDRAYHEAGKASTDAKESFNARKAADTILKTCVLETGTNRSAVLAKEYGLSEKETELLYIGIANLMYRAVRIGGMPCTGLPWRWGYGWPGCEGI